MSRIPVAVQAFLVLLLLVTLAVTSAASKSPPGKSAPTNTALPSISGTPAVGSTLQASSGSWQGPGISYSFQWQHCSSSSSCAPVTEASGSSYLVAGADAGDTLKVSVTAKNKYGSATATSAPTGVVPSSSTGYTNTALPAISGLAQAGQTLTVSNGSWSPTASTFQYAWHRCQNGSCSLSPTTSNQASYNVQSADVGYTIVAQIAPAGNWSDSVDSQQTATVASAPISPSPTGTVIFDGRANKMSQLYSYETTPGVISTLQHGQSPNVWSCLCFLKNDISLVPDSTYGQVYKAAVATGDTNPWGGSSADHGAAQVSLIRPTDLGSTDWYAFGARVNSWNGPVSDLEFSELLSLGYQTSQGSQVALGMMNNKGVLSWSIDQNAGYANNATGWAAGTTAYTQAFKPVTFNQWEEFVVGVTWSTHQAGEVQVWNRAPGGTWAKVFEKTGIDTELYGVTPNGTFAQDGSNWPQVLDKIGLYFLEAGGESETVYESGLTRSSDQATAESTFP